MSTPNWSELPDELVRIIAEKLEFSHDFIRFGAVCHPWRSVTLTLDKRLLFLKSFPWLMLPSSADDDDDDDYEDDQDQDRRFFIPFENRICHIKLPEARGCHCWGSPYGWLLTFGFDQQFHLLNPLTRVRLPLPPRSTFEDSFFDDTNPGKNRMCCVRKAFIILTSDNNVVVENNFLVLLTIGEFGESVFARPGDKTWSVIEAPGYGNMKDIIRFNGQFYGVDELGHLKVCDFRGPHPVFVDFANHPEGARGSQGFYLVELGGDLHMVNRLYDPTPVEFPPKEFHHVYKSIFFHVLKFDFCTRKWEILQTLGDHAIFIGSNTSFGFKASDYLACKPGCIYFTDDYNESFGRLLGADMGIYNHKANTIEPVYQGNDILSRFSPPVWITPNSF
ncbi:hypothetical protein AQUCO_07200031v1 [Aquilegia coerulea]|uniref:DUF295 domain-containing protein n=1 Tax=Aquilegia coerulea TaxID=218851 RepID=A0A2G5CA30_AQUCA|nr:hypothetical protein AQUCO_07200031v1 [Aquilegia coerulea]